MGVVVSIVVMLTAAVPATTFAGTDPSGGEATATVEPDPRTAEQASVQDEVAAQAQEAADLQRRHLVDEAIAAVQMTHNAMNLLSEESPKTDEAIGELEKAVGKLELLIARNPSLAMIPVAVGTKTHDVIALPETVESMVAEAEAALDGGDVQHARRILNKLASEFVVSTTRLPLATYPDAIKAAVPLIDAGKIAEAKTQIQTALNLLVVEEVIYPLPLMRAEAMLAAAETLAENDSRIASENVELTDLLDAARRELAFGQTLGYYTADDVAPLYGQIDEIEAKTEDGQSGTGFFDKLKGMVSDLFERE
jgi:hypothetical protein